MGGGGSDSSANMVHATGRVKFSPESDEVYGALSL